MKEINSYGFNMADDTRKVRVEERLKIKIAEAKNLPARNHGTGCHRDSYCVLCLDQEEIFRTSTIERTTNPFFGEEFQFEIPRRFRYLSLYMFDKDKNQDKVVGKVAIKREDIHRYNNKDHWFTIRPVDADSEVQGKAHIEVTLDDSRNKQTQDELEPKPPDPDSPATADNKTKPNLLRLSDYCKESIRFGACSNSGSKKLLEQQSPLSRSESLNEGNGASKPMASQHTVAELDSVDTSPQSVTEYWSDPERHCDSNQPDTLKLRVIECSELTTKNGQCDPFAQVVVHYSDGRVLKQQTKTKKKTVNPLFDELFEFKLLLHADPKDKQSTQMTAVALEVRVSVWHDAASPVFLGQVRVPLIKASSAPHTKAWYFLSSRKEGVCEAGWWRGGATPPGTRLSAGGATLGSLRLLLNYTVDHVFPLPHYHALQRLFLNSVHQKPITTSAVYILGEIVSNKTDAAQPLVRLFMHHDLIVPIIKELADSEISLLTDATTIFRGNTLVSKMMDEAMRLYGSAYLHGVLRPTLTAVLAERRPCEIDPARVKPAAAVTSNLANLKDYVERVFAAITSSYALCPPVMCRLFDALRHSAARHFPNNHEVRYSVVSGFIFLRFFAPAILGPKLFELTNGQIDPQTNRTLTLISKTIQSLGNLVSSRSAQQVCKEEYMAELYKSFCTPKHVQAIKQFLEIISSNSNTQNNSVQDTPVLLKEGTMIKRSESFMCSTPGSPRRRRWPRGTSHAKKRHFRLTSGELWWSRCGSRVPARRLSLSGMIAVAPLDHPPAGAPLGVNNIFQIVHRERVVYVQANNCVERAEWVRLLTALCRRPAAAHQHSGHFRESRWTCCDRAEAVSEGCCAGEEAGCGEGAGALRLDPPRDLQRLHALLVAHSHTLDDRLLRPTDGINAEDREAEAATLRELQEAMFDLEHRHRIYRRSLARETKYGSKQAPIGDDNYLHLAGASGNVEGGAFPWRTWRNSPPTSVELDGTRVPVRGDLSSSCESMERGYTAMFPRAPARPPRPRAPCEYVDVAPRLVCTEYDLTTTHPPPAVPPRASPNPPPPLMPKPPVSPATPPDDAYCLLKVIEDTDPPEHVPRDDNDSAESTDKEDYGIFSRISIQRKSNPIKPQANAFKPLKTSNSTSNVHDAGATSKPPLSERLTPFFLKKKSKTPPQEVQTMPKSSKKEENLFGRLTPRFNQSRLIGRGQSLELDAGRRVERSATSCNVATRPLNSSIVGNYKLFSLHKYGATEPVHGQKFVQTPEEGDQVDSTSWHPARLLTATDNDIRL